MNDSGVMTPISVSKGLKLIANYQFQANIAVYQYNAAHCTADNAAICHQIGLVASKLAARPGNLDHFRVITVES